MAHNGFHLHQGGKAIASRLPQVQQAAPLIPTRDEILDLILDHYTFQQIAVKTRTSLATVYEVNATYMQQYLRQVFSAKLDASPAVLRRMKEVEAECWSEYGITRRAA
jgi:hypothetical protein